MGLLPPTAAVTGQIRLGGLDFACLREAELCRIRGSKVGMIFQDPLAALNPVFPISTQIVDTVRTHHKGTSRSAARAIAADAISEMGVPRDRLDSYPHQLSGGMRQRVLIASAMVAKPQFLIADEPTSDLDTVSQAQILRILRRLRSDHRVGVLLISHDMRVVRAICDRVAVMQGRHRHRARPDAPGSVEPSRAVHQGADASQYAGPCARRPVRDHAGRVRRLERVTDMSPLVSIENLTYAYEVRRGLRHSVIVAAVSGVSLTVQQGSFVSIVGESGSGKSTLGRCVVGLLRPSGGRVIFDGQDITRLSGSQLTAFRRSVQIVFQNPYQSLNPRMTVGAALREVLRVTAPPSAERDFDGRVSELLDMVHLPVSYRAKYPHQLSGGQRQRVAIARAMAVRPKLLIADEPVSALDVSASAHVLNLLQELQSVEDLTCMFITHDIGLARLVSNSIVVMHAGRIVETGTPDAIFDNPQDEYTKLLVGADLGSQTANPDEIANQDTAKDTESFTA